MVSFQLFFIYSVYFPKAKSKQAKKKRHQTRHTLKSDKQI